MDYRISHYNDIKLKSTVELFQSLLIEKRMSRRKYRVAPYFKTESKIVINNQKNNFETALTKYKNIEDMYINIIKEILENSGIKKMKICELAGNYIFLNIRDHKELFEKEYIRYIKKLKIKDGKEYIVKDILEIIRLCLRGVLWCKIIWENIYIYTGYGYYINTGGMEIDKTFIEKELKKGITIEEIKNK